MKGIFSAILPLTLLLTGCYTEIKAPGAIGKVVDAVSGQPVHGARITRLGIEPGFRGGAMIPQEIPPACLTDKTGYFNLNPAKEPQIAFMYIRNPDALSGKFLITADGYLTNEVEGVATDQTSWRADLGRVMLQRR